MFYNARKDYERDIGGTYLFNIILLIGISLVVIVIVTELDDKYKIENERAQREAEATRRYNETYNMMNNGKLSKELVKTIFKYGKPCGITIMENHLDYSYSWN